MHRIFITALACLISLSVFGQTWEQTFGNTYNFAEGQDVKQVNDGGYVVTGSVETTFNGVSSMYLIKTDNFGIEQWSHSYGFQNNSLRGSAIQQTSDGGYIIVGSIYSFPDNLDLYLLKTDANGIEQWNQSYGDIANEDFGTDVQQTSDGGYIITGQTQNLTNGNETPFLLKTDENGLELWSQTYDVNYNYGRSVQQTSDGGYIIAGGDYNNSGFLIKTDSEGVEEWSQNISLGSLYSVHQTNDDGFIVAGSSYSAAFIIKVDNSGIEQWLKSYDDPFTMNIELISIEQTVDGGFISAGSLRGVNGNEPTSQDICLIKLDTNGEELWIQTFGGENDDRGRSVQQTIDGGYIITGTNSWPAAWDKWSGAQVYLIKTDPEGTLSSSFNILTPSPRNLEKVVDALGREVHHTTNKILFHIYDDGSVEKKFMVE